MSIRRRPGRFLAPARFLRDRRAAAAVEFALLLPLMLTLFVGGNEVAQALSVFRKVGHTSSTLGDLVAQSPTGTVSAAEMTDIIAAASSVMTPYAATGAKIVIAGVKYTTSNGYKVCWSAAQNDTTWTTNAAPPITMPTGMLANNEQIVVTRVRYTYTSPFSTIMQDIWGTASITLADVTYFRPRVTSTISYNGTSCP